MKHIKQTRGIAIKPEWWSLLEDLGGDDVKAVIKGLLDVMNGGKFDFERVSADGRIVAKALILQANHQRHISEVRSIAGRSGGQKKAENRSLAKCSKVWQSVAKSDKRKQSVAKSGKRKQSVAKPLPYIKEVVVDKSTTTKKVAVDDGAIRARRGKVPTIEQFAGGALLAGVPEDFARQLYGDLVAAGWADADGRRIANWRRYLKSAFDAEQKKISAARADGVQRTGTIADVADFA